MRAILKIKRASIIISLIGLGLFFLTQCINKKNTVATTGIKNANGEEFAGSVVCAQCHKNIYDSNVHTAHYLTSRPAATKYVKGNFQQGKNTFVFNPFVSVVMEKRDTDFYQVEYVNGVEARKERFDIVVGSGKKGQSYLYWNGNHLSQLPIFYYSAKNEWANSPGYAGTVIFSRPITSRCLECHTTYVQKISDAITQPEAFDHDKIIFGVDCEKCHGPAERHVEYQLQNPKEAKGKFIINPSALSRQQQLDLCALCHGGRLTKTKESFSFEAGDTLSNYFLIDTSKKDAANIDVHGNQYGLLAASTCFKMSGMTCSTCHDPHKNENGEIISFSQKCMSCHNEVHGNFCKMKDVPAEILKQNCIDCHMPVQASRAIVFLEQGSNIPKTAFMRSHYIKVYPDETKKILAALKNKQIDSGAKSTIRKNEVK
jgi:hypothetical protein